MPSRRKMIIPFLQRGCESDGSQSQKENVAHKSCIAQKFNLLIQVKIKKNGAIFLTVSTAPDIFDRFR